MQDKVFIDTNVFIYLYSKDEQVKKDIATKFITNSTCYTSTQAINELSNVFVNSGMILYKNGV